MAALLIILGALTLLWFASALSKGLEPRVQRQLQKWLLVLLVLGGAVLALRLGSHWLALAGVGVWAGLRRLLPLAVRFLPWAWRRWATRGQPRVGQQASEQSASRPQQVGMTRREALEVLGLQDDASRDDVMQAYKRLIGKVHPDKPGGSQYLASKLNQAKAVLLSSG